MACLLTGYTGLESLNRVKDSGSFSVFLGLSRFTTVSGFKTLYSFLCFLFPYLSKILPKGPCVPSLSPQLQHLYTLSM